MVPNFFNEDWRFWQVITPKDGLVGTMIGLAVLAFLVHIVVLTASDRYAAGLLG